MKKKEGKLVHEVIDGFSKSSRFAGKCKFSTKWFWNKKKTRVKSWIFIFEVVEFKFHVNFNFWWIFFVLCLWLDKRFLDEGRRGRGKRWKRWNIFNIFWKLTLADSASSGGGGEGVEHKYEQRTIFRYIWNIFLVKIRNLKKIIKIAGRKYQI